MSVFVNKVKSSCVYFRRQQLFEIHITLIHGSCSSKSSVLEKYIASINYKQVDFYFHRHYIIFDQSEKRTSPRHRTCSTGSVTFYVTAELTK